MYRHDIVIQMGMLLFRSLLRAYDSYLDVVQRVKQFHEKRHPDQHQVHPHVA